MEFTHSCLHYLSVLKNLHCKFRDIPLTENSVSTSPILSTYLQSTCVIFGQNSIFPLTLTTTCGKITIWLHTWYSAAGTFKIIPVTAQTTVTEVISAALEKFGLKVCLKFQCIFSSIYGYFPSLLPFFLASSLPQFPFISSWLFPNPSVLSSSFFTFSFLPPLL